MNRFLRDWLGASTGGQRGVDDRTRADRATILAECGFVDVTVLRHEYNAQLTPQYVVGHLYSALSEAQVPVDRRAEFEASVLAAIERGHTSERLVEQVPVIILAATTPER